MDKHIVSREPWWHMPPLPDQDELTCQWEWLVLWSDGSFTVDPSRPTDEEIANRKSCRLPAGFSRWGHLAAKS